MNQQTQEIPGALAGADKMLIGIGSEWKLAGDGRDIREHRLDDPGQTRLKEACGRLCESVKDKDYHAVTTVTGGVVYGTGFGGSRAVASCGNIHWRQYSAACTKDIWEEGKVPGDVYPHCGTPLTENTLGTDQHMGEGYLPHWEAYKRWQTGAPDRNLVILELREGFKTPTAIR